MSYYKLNLNQMLDKLLVLAFITTSLCLSGSAASSFCHCDLTLSFCDVGCCCDSDCSSNTVSDCYYLKSNSYCPDPTFFSRLGTTYLNSQGCFYYNSTNAIVDQVSTSTRLTTQIISEQKEVVRVNASLSPVWGGYQQTDTLAVSNNTNLYFIDNSGNCLATTDTTTTAFNIRFGLNTKIACKYSSTTTLPQLFSVLSGATISQFRVDSSKTISLPTITDASITDVQINFIIGTYGSSKIKYIQRVTSSSSSVSGSLTRSLTFKFVQVSDIGQRSSSPSFFPQIPKDMFYPIYLLS